jgi:hypothetical protein
MKPAKIAHCQRMAKSIISTNRLGLENQSKRQKRAKKRDQGITAIIILCTKKFKGGCDLLDGIGPYYAQEPRPVDRSFTGVSTLK